MRTRAMVQETKKSALSTLETIEPKQPRLPKLIYQSISNLIDPIKAFGILFRVGLEKHLENDEHLELEYFVEEGNSLIAKGSLYLLLVMFRCQP